MSPRRSISASLRARRALLLAEGRRRFYVFPLDVGPHSTLGKVSHASPSDCIAAAHSWLQRVRLEESWWFSIVERAELPGQSVTVSVQDFLVFNDLLLPAPKRRGCDSGAGRVATGEPGASGSGPGAGTIFAFDGAGAPCRRRNVPRIAKNV